MHRPPIHICRIIVLLAGLWIHLPCRGQDSSTLHIVPPNTIYQNDSAIRFEDFKQAPSIKEHTLPDSTIKKLRKDDAFWYVNTTPEKIKQDAQNKSKTWNMAWLGKLFWFMVICAFLIIAVLFLRNTNLKLFRKRAAMVAVDAPPAVEENIFSMDFDTSIRKAVSEGAYTTAVRLYYLSILKILSDRQLIDYAVQKTNSLYVLQLTGSPYYDGFLNLTRIFEKVWYGKFPLDQSTYNNLEKDFKQFRINVAS